MSKHFGKTWWGEQWLNSLAEIDYGNRLERGSRYARNGSIKSININNNQINAKVIGSRPRPYNVDIILPPFFDPELSNFIKAVSLKPTIISKLLNRELDPQVLNLAEDLGLKVFPKKWTDFKMQCSCPDWAVPCKHLAAVIYKVSSEIDNNPFLVFDLHNVNIIKELEKIGIHVNKQSSEILKINDLYFEPKLKIKPEKFIEENAYVKLVFSGLLPIHESLAVLLTDYPVFYQGTGNFKEKYVIKINTAVLNAQKLLKGKTSFEKLNKASNELKQFVNHKSVNKITIDENHHSKVLVNSQVFSLDDFIQELTLINSSQKTDYQPSTAALHSVYQLALHLIANGAVVPQIVLLPNKSFAIRWLPAIISKEVRNLVNQLKDSIPPGTFIWEEKLKLKEINKDVSFNLVSVFITRLMNVFAQGINDDLYLDLFFKECSYPFSKPGESAFSGGIQTWLQKYYISKGRFKPQLIVEETKNDTFKISLAIEDLSQNKIVLPIPLETILTDKTHQKNRYEILQSLTQLSQFIQGLDAFINSEGKEEIIMNMEMFTPFLMQVIPAIQLLDISIVLPKSLQHILKPKVSLKLKKKTSGTSFLRLDQLLDFDWQVAIGDTLMNEEDFKKLLDKSDGLIKYKTKYIYVNQDDLQKIHKHFSEEKALSPLQLLQTALSGEYSGSKIDLTDEVLAMIKELTNVDQIPLPKGINAELRPYQLRGYSWMYRNSKIGFGSVLADDMGLGKTLQTITTILKYKEDGMLKNKKVLVVAPTGLLTNWQKELEKFAPKLKTSIYHGTNRKIEKNVDVLISSYGILRSDASKLKKLNWHTLIIDEAQNIKNINTEQTKAVKSIGASNFIALSGTPVENRLSELWSIMDYSNRGLLGNLKDFAETFSNPIEQFNNVEVADKLKKVTAPFLMRRLKSDKSIISDLPDKIEMDCFSSLANEQASLYEKTLEKAINEIEGINGKDQKALFVRQGLILQMILALKQICNHPTQFLKNNILDASLSGKLELLFNKLDSIVESGEKVLIFTQFTEMGNLLKHFIKERYKEEPLFYHGGCNLKQRNEMVNSFQTNRAEKLFILSLKAAGTGLNLTAANHVIHYDLWWNPAVEAQATDRAYRIGQKSNVMVHRFITKNTFEERINQMIQSKKALANMTVATGENWIGQLSNKQLQELFKMS
jgi:uncharacterized Zn finger protein/ERCC4-related helicase